MTGLRVEVDLGRISHNASTLVARLAARGIAVTGVTKAMLGLPALATILVDAGVTGLGDSRVENLERLQRSGVLAPTLLLRSPMLSQVDRVIEVADTSCNTEPEILDALSYAAQRAGVDHGVLLMVELGDLREGILPDDLVETAKTVVARPGLRLRGIGTNLACRSGVVPDDRNMHELSTLAAAVEAALGVRLEMISGGNSANLGWAMGTADVGRVNHLRLGEAILLGRDPLDREPIEGLHTDAVEVVAEVIESRRKPSMHWGTTAQAAFGTAPGTGDPMVHDRWQTLLAIGHQDTDPAGLTPPDGVRMLGASSDHLVVETRERVPPGAELRFVPGYGALVRAMTSPFANVISAERTERR